MTPVLEAHRLTKRFGRTQALAGLDLVAEPGRVVALLGAQRRGQDHLRPGGGHLAAPGLGELAGRWDRRAAPPAARASGPVRVRPAPLSGRGHRCHESPGRCGLNVCGALP